MDTTRTMVDLLERFCTGFASGDAEAIAATCTMTVELAIVTSEELVLRGGEEFATFLDRYMRGNTRYAWMWDRHDVATYGDVAWLLAIGTETATTGSAAVSHPYRMTMVATRTNDHWYLVQVHGSSPHQDPAATETPITADT